MTDLTPELGSTATCPHCGAQVDIPNVEGTDVRCPSCGEVVEGGVRDQATEDLTNHEILRAFSVRGYLTDVTVVEPDSLRCENCGTVNAPGDWAVDDVRQASNMTTPGAPESAMVALRCPSCQEMGRVELPLQGLDATPEDRVHAALLDAWDRRR